MDDRHRQSDLQSLLLNQAAIEALRRQPERLAAVQAVLDHWDRVAPPASKPLRDEWRDILSSGTYERALAPDEHGQQLRQASPLGRALSPQARLAIIRSCKGRISST
ncbi:MAG: hypothetical protein MUF03_14800 [Rubrivivax sp.]|jgi:hypothetical protein|nr:hypothetical protein [Rubrivivax sp.]